MIKQLAVAVATCVFTPPALRAEDVAQDSRAVRVTYARRWSVMFCIGVAQ
jgi:hypothetical protein